ncbi:hypothetical protein HRbin36_01642 [bacterium HR36]|nr:hypothetical protein HRbin36_01642 [bacterium HR36]
MRLSTDAGNQAYRGQLIHLYLDIHFPEDVPAPALVDLDIPWLGREFGFRWRLPAEQWLCALSLPANNSLACRIFLPRSLADIVGLLPGPYIIYAPPAPDSTVKTWKLTWQLILDKPLFGNQVTFAPVSLKVPGTSLHCRSAPISVTVLDTPPVLSLRTAFVLPPGKYTVWSSCHPTVTFVGQPVRFQVCISGSGALEDIDADQLYRTIARELANPLLYGGETWLDPQTRCFRWQLDFKAAASWAVPPTQFLALNPHLERPNYQELTTAQLLVRVLPALTMPAIESNFGMPQLSLRKVASLNSSLDTFAISWPINLISWLLPPAVWCAFALVRWHLGRLLVWHRYDAPTRQMLNALKQQRRSQQLNAYVVWRLCQDYLRHRLNLSSALSAQQVASALQAVGLEASTLSRFVELLSILEQAAFAPDGNLRATHLEELRRLIISLDRQLAATDVRTKRLAP